MLNRALATPLKAVRAAKLRSTTAFWRKFCTCQHTAEPPHHPVNGNI